VVELEIKDDRGLVVEAVIAECVFMLDVVEVSNVSPIVVVVSKLVET
jgi:hypothetical protein